ncbi:hypothetical protein BB559_004549 [Furculomyces boomerangus]|uniref:LITAF domain-containing protein n=2 Tax=Harpellales TaxID=61421 RepID=A0A2T9YE26_9FUNG|nr:hypothetical protein BB559_004549 [Furculomyces boomerangus]PWA01417.1 hypothetical protein BB558_002487 [Smittium angustum]
MVNMKTKETEAYTQVHQNNIDEGNDPYLQEKDTLYNNIDLPSRNTYTEPNEPQVGEYVIRGNSALKFKGTPVNTTCPNCGQNIVPLAERKHGVDTLWAVTCLGVLFWPLMWIPLVMDSLKNSTHICPNCKADLGKYILVQVHIQKDISSLDH